MEDTLRTLIAEVCRFAPSSPERRKALNRLLAIASRLPNLYRSSHPNYLDALNRTLLWVSEHLQEFEERPPSVVESFTKWVNGYLKWRIKDLYIPDSKYLRANPIVTDDEGRSVDMVERLPDPSLSTLEAYIAAEQSTEQQHQYLTIQAYIQQDPEQTLRTCHPRQHPDCHCQLLAMHLLLQEPPQAMTDLARDLGVNYQTLNSHWKRRCLCILRDLCLQIGAQP